MKRTPSKNLRCRGAVAPLMALLLVPILGIVAFAVDMGWIVLAKSDLQKAADAAALAGAQQLIGQRVVNPNTGNYVLVNGFAQYYQPGQILQDAIATAGTTAAVQAAQKYAGYNSAGGVSSLTLNSSDVYFGTTDGSGNYTPLYRRDNGLGNGGGPYTSYPNTIKVILRLDNQANGPLPLFFARVFGMNTTNLTATASATIYSGSVNSFNINPNFRSRILPVAYDVNHWNNFLNTGLSPDGTLNLDSLGIPQLQVYPSLKYTGDFGLLSMDQYTNDGASTFANWIQNGVSSTDLQQEFNAHLLPLSAHDPTKWDWIGKSGLKASDIQYIAPYVGDIYVLPLFKPVDPGVPNPLTYTPAMGNGTNYYYNIVQFVGIKITNVNILLNYIDVQPAPVTDPNAVFGSVAPEMPPSSGSPLVTTFSTCKLTQ